MTRSKNIQCRGLGHSNNTQQHNATMSNDNNTSNNNVNNTKQYRPLLLNNNDRSVEALKQLFCGGVAGSAAKTVTAPLSRLTILYQVHSMVTTKQERPKFAMTLSEGMQKIVQRGGLTSMWRGNFTSVLHRFPFSAINFFVYENMLDLINGRRQNYQNNNNNMMAVQEVDDEDSQPHAIVRRFSNKADMPLENTTNTTTMPQSRLIAGATAGSIACIACYPLDLVRTRLTTELEGHEHYRGIVDAFKKIARAEGWRGFYSGLGPTLMVAVPNFSISYTVYGTLKEYALDDELFYNLRKIDAGTGQASLGFRLTLLCGAASGILSTVVTFPFDTIRRRMQIQNLHIPQDQRMTSRQQVLNLVQKEGLRGIYRGLTPELLKVVPMVGTMFLVYEFTKEQLGV